MEQTRKQLKKKLRKRLSESNEQFEHLLRTYEYKKVKSKNGVESYTFVRKPSSKRRYLTRWEIWTAIQSKYKNMKYFHIDAPWKNWSWYVERNDLFNLMLEMKIHKSRHLTREQKRKVEAELKMREIMKAFQGL